MILHALLFGLMLMAGVAHAMQPLHPPGQLPDNAARMLLEQHPRVAAARAGLEVARQEATNLESSPYEWTAKVNTQRRTQKSRPHKREWNAGIERTIRLPGKAAADRNIGLVFVVVVVVCFGVVVFVVAWVLLFL